MSRKALRLRFRLTSVPRHGFKWTVTHALCGGFGSPLPSSGSVLPGGGVRGVGVGCRVTLIIFPRRVNFITGVGLDGPAGS